MAKLSFPTKELIRSYFDENKNWLNEFELNLDNQEMGFKDGSKGYYFSHHVNEEKFKDINCAYSIMNNFRSEYIGIDIPTLIEPDHYTKTIMIIGQDPLRSKKPVQAEPDPNTVFIGTPYAVEIDTVKTKNTGGTSNLKVYRNIFDKLLNEGYRIYLTDALKFYTSSKKSEDQNSSIEKYTKKLKDPNVISNRRPEALLEAEYNQIKPDLVCCFGDKAYEIAKHTAFSNALKKVFHPSYLSRIFGNNNLKLSEYCFAELTGSPTAAQEKEFKDLQKKKSPSNSKTAATKNPVPKKTKAPGIDLSASEKNKIKDKLISEGLINARRESVFINSILDQTNGKNPLVQYFFEKNGLYINVFWKEAVTPRNTDIMLKIIGDPKKKTSEKTTHILISDYSKTSDEIVSAVKTFEDKLKNELGIK